MEEKRFQNMEKNQIQELEVLTYIGAVPYNPINLVSEQEFKLLNKNTAKGIDVMITTNITPQMNTCMCKVFNQTFIGCTRETVCMNKTEKGIRLKQQVLNYRIYEVRLQRLKT